MKRQRMEYGTSPLMLGHRSPHFDRSEDTRKLGNDESSYGHEREVGSRLLEPQSLDAIVQRRWRQRDAPNPNSKLRLQASRNPSDQGKKA